MAVRVSVIVDGTPGSGMMIEKGLEADTVTKTTRFEFDGQADAGGVRQLLAGVVGENVPLSLAPAESQKIVKEFTRPEYETLFKRVLVEPQLDQDDIVFMFDRWDREVGGSKVKE